MNDPNGFCFYKGEYHLFYQYHPYNSYWGPMHWGHAVSKDLIFWEYLPAALAPDADYDRDGCFSGSAVTLDDGRQLLMYTGVANEIQEDGSSRGVQTQCIAVGDGIDYEKYAGNPVLDESDLPEEFSRFDFRDPKIWRTENGAFRCVTAGCLQEHDGQILLFGSRDGLRWKFEKVIVRNGGRFGKMWECPDFFELDGRQVLLVSPQDMLPQGLEYHNGNGTVCFIGDYDRKTDTFFEDRNQAVDYGIDFYAPQTVSAPDGRRIMIGWMQNWETSRLHSPDRPWFGQMSLPRELSIKEGMLIQRPVRELERFREGHVRYAKVDLNNTDSMRLRGIRGRRIDMEITLRPGDTGNIYRRFEVRFAENDVCHTSISFRPFESVLKIDRQFSGSRKAVVHQCRCSVRSEEGRMRMRLILDHFSAEVFVNDGEQVLSTTIYTDLLADGISFSSNGSVSMGIEKYDLCLTTTPPQLR